MKKRLFPLLAALLCMVMLMGCTTHAGPESNKLTEAELQELQELFAPGSWYAQACTSYYEAAEAVDLGRLFYDGIGYAGLVYGQCYVTDRERDWVLEQEPAAENYGIFRAPRAAMDDILRQYFDISLDDTRKMGLDNLLYWEEADAWSYSSEVRSEPPREKLNTMPMSVRSCPERCSPGTSMSSSLKPHVTLRCMSL